MNRLLIILYALVALLLASCTGRRHQQMLAQLEELERQNVADSLMTNDSLALALTDFFDRHGTPNEQLRAHYILGRTYADMGEIPHAVECFQEAIACADTAAPDCDFKKLSSAYAQMADAYYKQLLLSANLEARTKAYHYALLSKDTLIAISEMKLSSGALILSNRTDSAEALLQKVILLYNDKNRIQDAINTSLLLMHIYIERPDRQRELKRLIDQYDNECSLFDKNHELPLRKRKFYYYKGRYFDERGMLDSAEFYYRKLHKPNMQFTSLNSMYKGLLSVYTKRHDADSIAKYAQLYCQANDSSIALKDQEQTALLSASYQYNYYKNEALQNEKEADEAKYRFVILSMVSVILVIAFIMIFFKIRKHHRQRFAHIKKLYAETMDDYQKNIRYIRILEDAHQKAIDSLNMQYENNITELKAENENMKKITDNLLRESKDLRKYAETSKVFFDSEIVAVIREKIKTSNFTMCDVEWNNLISKAGECFPLLVKDLNGMENSTLQKTRTCILVILHLHTDEIAYMLQVIPQRVTNIKRDINESLFEERSARSLYTNIVQKYNIIA